jgi:hypothetical protein
VERREFLKNSLGALLFGAISSNKVLASVVDTLTPTSPKVLLYLIQNIKGEWKIKASKWVDLPKSKLQPTKVIQSTFKPLDIVDLNQVVIRRKELWKEYNCSGKMGHLVSLGICFDDEMKEEYKELGYRHKGKIVSKETLKKMSEVNKGKKHTEETKQICRQKSIGLNVGRKRTEEQRKKISEKRKGSKASEKTRKILSESAKKRINHFNQEAIINRRLKTIKPILCYSFPEMKYICEYESIKSAAINLNRDRGGILKILNGTIKEPRKLTFRYKNTLGS